MLPGMTGGTVMTGMPDEHAQVAATFAQQATVFRSIMPAGGPESADSGDQQLDDALTQILELIGDLHTQLSATIVEYGRGLQRASESAQERS